MEVDDELDNDNDGVHIAGPARAMAKGYPCTPLFFSVNTTLVKL